MKDIKKILDSINNGNGRLAEFLDGTDFDFDAEEFFLRDFDRDMILEENPDIDKEELKFMMPILCPAFNGEGDIRYNGHMYFQSENDFSTPEYSLCSYNEEDWTLVHKLLDYMSKEKMIEYGIPSECVEKVYVECNYMVFGR